MFEPIGKTLKNKKTPLPGQRKKRFFMKSTSTEFYVKGHTQVPNLILHDPALSSQDLRILEVLDHHSMNKDHCNPGIETIAFGARCGQATVSRCLKNLRKLKYIDWERTQGSNDYTLIYKVQKS